MEPRRKGLGRGMASLIPLPPVAKEVVVVPEGGRRDFLMIPIEDVMPNPHQPRKFFDEQKIEELANSIREKGILQPILVSRVDERFELISGERRLRAAKVAGLKEVPAVVREAGAPDGRGGRDERLELAIIENVQRQDLDPIEEAQAYQELMERFSFTQEQVALKVGKDRATVANTLRLVKLPTKVKQALQAGQLSVGHARALLGIPEIEKQIYFTDRIIEEGWSVRELEIRVASKRVMGFKKKLRQIKPLSSVIVRLIDDLRRRMGTQVRVVPSGEKGKIIIEYYSELDLDRLCQILVK